VNEEVRRAVYDVVISKDNSELVGRGGRDERQSLLSATDRHVALIGRRRLTEHGIEPTGRVGRRGGGGGGSGRPCCRLLPPWSGKTAGVGATAEAEVIQRDADGLSGPDDD